jgi:hypothetical protein
MLDETERSDLHSIALSLEKIAQLLAQLVESQLKLVATHTPPVKETLMAKAAKIGMAKAKPAAGGGPSGDKDTVTITALDNSTPPVAFPMTGATITAVPSDPTTLTTDAPQGATYGEHFLKAGTVTVAITATFPDGTVLTLTDSVVITGAPGSLVATHSIPILGP